MRGTERAGSFIFKEEKRSFSPRKEGGRVAPTSLVRVGENEKSSPSCRRKRRRGGEAMLMLERGSQDAP